MSTASTAPLVGNAAEGISYVCSRFARFALRLLLLWLAVALALGAVVTSGMVLAWVF